MGSTHRILLRGSAALVLLLAVAAAPATARADTFDGRIAFASTRSDPGEREYDIFSMNADGSDVRRLTTNPAGDRQPDWSPGGRAIAYTIDKPQSRVNFEVARMTAAGIDHRRLTTTPTGQASSQPAWTPSGRAILYRRSGSGLISSIWQMGPFGERPALCFAPANSALYPSLSPRGGRVVFAAILSPRGDTDRAIFTLGPGGGAPAVLFDVPGAWDSAPAWSPDGRRIAFESDADVGGANPERDMEVWTMAADGSGATQLTHNAAHDEGPAWSPDGRLLAYATGPDDARGDIAVMTAAGAPRGTLTSFAGADESPDWQAIRAPRTDRRCGDAGAARDVRRAGPRLRCAGARSLARRWAAAGRPPRLAGYRATATDFGGTLRVTLVRGAGARRTLVAFLHAR